MDIGYFITTKILKETEPVAEGAERLSEAVGIVGLVTEPGNLLYISFQFRRTLILKTSLLQL